MSEKQYIKNRRVDDLATAPTPQNTPATTSTIPTPASQAPVIPTIKEEDGMSPVPRSASVLCLICICSTFAIWVFCFPCFPVTRFTVSALHELIAYVQVET
jgi:hypothetical protein